MPKAISSTPAERRSVAFDPLTSPRPASHGPRALPNVRMLRASLLLFAQGAVPAALAGQLPLSTYADAFETRAGAATPDIRYDVRLDTTRVRLSIVMRVTHAPDTVRLAIPRWAPGAYRVADFASRLRGVVVRTGDIERSVADSGLGAETVWPASGRPPLRVIGGQLEVRYEIVGDTAPNNRGFLRQTGALLDGPATYLYLLGRTLAPARVHFEHPGGWHIVTGLVPTADPDRYFAASYDMLVDSPVLFGDDRSLLLRVLDIDGVPHRVAWWRRVGAPAFDTAAFLAPITPIVRETRRIFGWIPYREYAFLYVDGAGGGLEHLNSTTIGMRASTIAREPLADVDVSAHEYFHHWNVKRIRPVALGPFDYQHVTRTRSLWLSEGVTDYYAGVLLRRGGIVTEDDARATLASSIQSYLGNPASAWLSPERSSFTAWDPPAVNRGYSLSYYLSGALLGDVLDVELRSRNPDGEGMDELMRRLRDRHAGVRGFTDADVVRIASSVCGCDMAPFFTRYVSGGAALPLENLVRSLGWKMVVERGPAVDSTGQTLPDRRISITPYGGLGSAGGAVGGALKLSVTDPTSVWGRAGLATGDTVVAVNDSTVRSPAEFQRVIGSLRVGDSVAIRIQRGSAPHTVKVAVVGYDRVKVRLDPLPQPSARQLRARRRWMHGAESAAIH